MTSADSLLMIRVKRPLLSSFPVVLPASANPVNHNHDTRMQEIPKTNRSVPEYCNELIPITPTVSKIAWGFNNDTDEAKAICLKVENPAFS